MLSRTLSELRGRTAFVPYLVGLFPDKGLFSAALDYLAEQGAAAIEIGIPFSDPIAEGKTIESAHHAVLRSGFSLDELYRVTADFKARYEIPLVAMGYYNSFAQPDIDTFCARARQGGFDAFLIVDLPSVEREIYQAIHRNGLETVQLIAPTSDAAAIEGALSLNPAFLYYITQRGVTGLANVDFDEVKIKVTELKRLSDKPVVVGFGIKTAEHVRAVKSFADGIVIGSSIVACLADGGDLSRLQSDIEPIADEIRRV